MVRLGDDKLKILSNKHSNAANYVNFDDSGLVSLDGQFTSTDLQGIVNDMERCNRKKIPDADDNNEGSKRQVLCCFCGKPTTWDSTYGDLCYRCIRADNE